MKKMTGKRMIPLIAALLALSMLITVFAMPDPLNVDRWPDPSNNGEAAILPGLYENYYITTDTWKREDYTSTYFSDNPLNRESGRMQRDIVIFHPGRVELCTVCRFLPAQNTRKAERMAMLQIFPSRFMKRMRIRRDRTVSGSIDRQYLVWICIIR